jgi:hypothetical protein
MNQLNAQAINVLLSNLPICNGEIYIEKNPGWDTCDKSIATAKGWWVISL